MNLSQAGILGRQPLSAHILRHHPTMIPTQSLHQNLEDAYRSGLMLSNLAHNGNLHLSGIQGAAPHADHFHQRQLKLPHSHDRRLSGIQDVSQGKFYLPVVKFGACWRLVFLFIALASEPLIVHFLCRSHCSLLTSCRLTSAEALFSPLTAQLLVLYLSFPCRSFLTDPLLVSLLSLPASHFISWRQAAAHYDSTVCISLRTFDFTQPLLATHLSSLVVQQDFVLRFSLPNHCLSLLSISSPTASSSFHCLNSHCLVTAGFVYHLVLPLDQYHMCFKLYVIVGTVGVCNV
jgi:hypothetical protein